MAPFGSTDSMDFFNDLPPLEEAPKSTAAQSLFEGLASLKQSRVLYRLALVDTETGRPLGYASDNDLERLASGSKPAVPSPPSPRAQLASHQQHLAAAEQQAKEPSFQTLLAETHKTGGPVCSHCGATESPQWRRGPPNKAILCNACGTRYRRTNQLGSAVPSTQRKRGAQHCGSEVAKAAGHPPKQPRVVA